MLLTKNTLSSIELNPVDICNRTCGFCPRGHGFKNTKAMMVDDTVIAINKSLQDIDYRGTVTFAGFGEPLLQKNLKKHVQLLSNNVQLKQIKLITNGDFLTQKTAFQLIDAGVNCIKISMYDVDDSERYEAFLSQYSHVERIYKHYYDGLPEEVEVNRTDIWQKSEELNINRACYLPFYKMFINWNGAVGLCSNDWSQYKVFGYVQETPIHKIWESEKFKVYRNNLMKNKRALNPCIKCNVNGQILGKESFEYYKNNV